MYYCPWIIIFLVFLTGGIVSTVSVRFNSTENSDWLFDNQFYISKQIYAPQIFLTMNQKTIKQEIILHFKLLDSRFY